MNFVDFLAILPYVLSALIESMQDLHILGKAGKIMRLVRVMRILRIFKLVRHFAGLQSLIYTLKQVCIRVWPESGKWNTDCYLTANWLDARDNIRSLFHLPLSEYDLQHLTFERKSCRSILALCCSDDERGGLLIEILIFDAIGLPSIQ